MKIFPFGLDLYTKHGYPTVNQKIITKQDGKKIFLLNWSTEFEVLNK